MIYTFNGTTKRITLPSGAVTLDLIDLHSRWKEWVLLGNAGFAQAFSTIGGETPKIPLYLFLSNGWKIVPQSANHTLSVMNGVLETDDAGEPFVDPAGSYSIRINRESPGIAIGYSTTGGTGPTADSIATAVLAALNATTGTRTVGQHLQIQTAVLAGNETGAGTTHVTFTDGTAVVEADVPLPGAIGNRTNVTISV